MTTPQASQAVQPTGRVNQKRRTRAAIVAAAAELMLTGSEVTMPEVAKAAAPTDVQLLAEIRDLLAAQRSAE